MSCSVVFTFIGVDKPGLVERLSKTVADNAGNWLESNMSQLAGQFAGIARVQTEQEQLVKLTKALTALNGQDLTIVVQQEQLKEAESPQQHHMLQIIGNDRPGIVREIAGALAARQINVYEMNTGITSAPMTAQPLFEATVRIQVPSEQDINELYDEMDDIANDLDIDISFDTE